jgi:two-component system chemotaxis response regulator CheY
MDIGRLSFLVVDDSEMMRDHIAQQLRELGAMDISEAGDGRAALTLLRRGIMSNKPIDVVFLDWEMPVMSGLDVLKQARTDPAFRNVAFMMVSSVRDEDRIRQIAPFTPNGYLVKPFSPEIFHERVLALCAKVQT